MNKMGRGRSRGSVFHRGSRSKTSHGPKASLSFWILAGFLTLIFLTGGSSRSDVLPLFILRAAAILVIAYGLMAFRSSHWRTYWGLLALTAATLLLVLTHLVPLPPAVWHALPQHAIVRAIDETADLQNQWRTLSLVPSASQNALYSLSIPIATLLLAIQLNTVDRFRILYVVLCLSCCSAIIGLMQSAGYPISLFHAGADTKTIEATGLFANRNHQAALLAAMLPMLAVVARVFRGAAVSPKLFRAVIGGAGVAVVILLIVTGSRSGLALGAIAIAFTLFYGLLDLDWMAKVSKRRAVGLRLAIGGLLVLVAGIITVVTARSLAFGRLGRLTDDLRPQLWASITAILPDFLPWGSGIGSFVEVYRSREPMELLREQYINHAHNEYLEVALTAGIPGICLLLTAMFMIFRALWMNREGDQPISALARLGGTIIVILGCASVTDYPLRTPLLSSVFILAAVWCVKETAGGTRQLQ